MRASSGTSSASILPFPTSPPASPAPSEDQTQSFADVLQQQDSTPAKPMATTPAKENAPAETTGPATNAKSVPVTATTIDAGNKIEPIVSTAATGGASGASVVSVTRTNATAPPPGKSSASTIPAGSDLATMMVQSMVLASHLSGAPVAKSSATPAASAPATSDAAKLDSTPGAMPDIATLIAQAMTFSASPANTTALSAKAAPSEAATAMASHLLATSGSVAGREIQLPTSTRASASATTKEKKSASGSPEGSFLQSSGTGSKSGANESTLIGPPVMEVDHGSGGQRVATDAFSVKSASTEAGASAVSSVGTAPVEKKASMSTDLSIPELMTATNVNTVSRAPADVTILLSTNHDFEDALKQVVHIASLNDAAAARTPTRIAIELQTPPGAIVNVYVSRQNDQYRAQLSTSDPAALSWVQDKITALRQSNDLGVEVKWLPAQIESNSLSATTTSSSGSNLNWNRDGQNQNNQQPDDRSQSQRQEQASYEDLAEAEAEAFSSSLAAVGGAA